MFAQILVGTTPERWLDWLLRATAWITLALGPIGIILEFQLKFLPYHSRLVTGTHRLLLFVELAIAFVLFPLVFHAGQVFSSKKVVWQAARVVAYAPFGFVALFLAFPGEPHLDLLKNLLRMGNSPFCKTILRMNDHLEVSFLAHNEGTPNFQPNFQGRDLNCGKFDRSDFSRFQFTRVQMREASLKSATLDHANFIEAQLQGSDFSNARLNNAMLEGSNLNETTLEGADLTDTKLGGAFLINARLNNATLIRTELKGAQLAGAKFYGARLEGANLEGATLNVAKLDGTDLSAAQLYGADLGETQLERVKLAKMNLEGAKLDLAKLVYADLSDTNLRRANLKAANLNHAVLNNAELQKADLFEAKLGDASLRGAKLQGATLSGADLGGADLSGAQFQGADLRFAKLRDAKNLGKADLRGARLENADLRGADLRGADLRGADLRGANLSGADLRGANLGGADLSEADLSNSRLDLAWIADARLLGAKGAVCSKAYGKGRKFEPPTRQRGPVIDTRERAKDEKEKTTWHDCEESSKRLVETEYRQQHADLLRDLVCNATADRSDFADAIVRNWISDDPEHRDHSSRLAQGLLRCTADADLSDEARKRLRKHAPTTTPVE